MRLIDADSLGVGRCNPDIMRDRAYAAGWNGLLNIVNNAKTVDANLIAHGKWIEEKYETISETRGRKINNTKNICSVCGKSNGRNKTKYCPNCGARMDG